MRLHVLTVQNPGVTWSPSKEPIPDAIKYVSGMPTSQPWCSAHCHCRRIHTGLKSRSCKSNILTQMSGILVSSVIACLYSLSSTVVCPWWTTSSSAPFPTYTHLHLISLNMWDRWFLLCLPYSVPRSVKPDVKFNKDVCTPIWTNNIFNKTYLLLYLPRIH
jgi:hypothetical protein